MLSMKTLRVAIVTMGSALLLGPGLAAATVQQLDGTVMPVTYATETLAKEKVLVDINEARTNVLTAVPNDVTGPNGQTTHYALVATDHEAHFLQANPSRKIEADESLWVRLDLEGGMVFNGGDVTLLEGNPGMAEDPDTAVTEFVQRDGDELGSTADTDQTAGGTAGDSFVVFRLTLAAGTEVALNEQIWFGVQHALAVPAGMGSYGASISAYTTADDAVDGRGAVGSIAGGATIVNVGSGLAASVTAGAPLVASVDHGFVRFLVGPSATSAQEMLGVFQAIANPRGVLSADDGLPAEDGDIIAMGDMAVTVAVEGDLSIGAFRVVGYTDAVEADTSQDPPVVAMDAMPGACPAGPDEIDDDPMNDDMGSLSMEEGVTDMGTQSLAAGMYSLCVNVDTAGPMSNMNAIPAGEYTATVSVLNPGAENPVEAASGTIGTIVRNGASVDIAYLTTSDKHNQRLIIVNRGNRPISITDIAFQSEDGTEVELSALAMAVAGTPAAMIPGGETRVIRIGGELGMLNITGDSRRTAATLSLNGTPGNISVATTQVNLSDSSTDTVMWEVK